MKFIDLFAGMGGFRLGFEQAAASLSIEASCVFSSEIKQHARDVYLSNYPDSLLAGDITQIDANTIEDFDVLLAGFPCQAFSLAGNRYGFADTRGTLFFEIERILSVKRPKYFILENVEGLIKHNLINKTDSIGHTLNTILLSLSSLGYHVTWKLLNSTENGVAQSRKRLFIVGSLLGTVFIDRDSKPTVSVGDIMEIGLDTHTSFFTQQLLSHYPTSELHGKTIQDKRGGEKNIHSWDIGLKGEVSAEQKILMRKIMLHRRYKHWAKEKGIAWMDGIPLTTKDISSFYYNKKLQSMLNDLVNKGYLVLEHPKDLSFTKKGEHTISKRTYREDLDKGYNIVVGKLSFEFSSILHPNLPAPTLVATDLGRLGVVDGDGIRYLSVLEKKRLFGYPDDYHLDITLSKVNDLIGNTVVVPTVYHVSHALLTHHLTLVG